MKIKQTEMMEMKLIKINEHKINEHKINETNKINKYMNE